MTFTPRTLVTMSVLAGLLTAACAGQATGPTPTATAPGTGIDAEVARFGDQELDWGSCASFARTDVDREIFADPAYDCTFVEAPLDYADPDGRVVRMAMLRRQALDPGARIGSLFVNPGGPGASGVTFLPALAGLLGDGPLAQRFDLIGFDPRGVGVSEPTIDCSSAAEIDAERVDLDLDTSPAGVAQTEAEQRDFAQRCADRVGLDVLAHVGTRDVARDLRIAYRAVGDEELSYVGYSYGTEIGVEFAEQFPTEVRALVLDGAVDPAQDPVESRLTQSRGFQRAFDNFAADCAARADCPLGADAAAASAALQELLRPLITTPVPAGTAGRTLGYNDALIGVLTALYSESQWANLRRGLARVTLGDGADLLELADDYYRRTPDGDYPNSSEAFSVINCVDRVPITDRAVALEISRRALEIAPFFDPGYGPSNVLEQCSFWPVPPTREPGPVEAPGLPRVLVVSSTGDPATPYEDGVSLARQLAARLLSVQNDSHTVSLQGVNGCADAVATRYLVDLVLPAGDATCAR